MARAEDTVQKTTTWFRVSMVVSQEQGHIVLVLCCRPQVAGFIQLQPSGDER